MDENDDQEDTNEIFIWHTQKLMNTQNEFQGEYGKVMKEKRGDSKATRCDVFYQCFFLLNIT